jgi:hypothetical protein
MGTVHRKLHNYRAKVMQEIILERKSTAEEKPFRFDSGGARYQGPKKDRNKLQLVLQARDIPCVLDTMFERVAERMERFLETYAELGSDWVLHRVSWCSLQLMKWQPAAGASYFPLRGLLADKKACVNVKNAGVACFELSLLAALHPAKSHVDQLYNYARHTGTLDLSMFPPGTPLTADPELLEKFERANNLAIHCFTVDQSAEPYEDPEMLYLSVFPDRDPITLLLVEDSAQPRGHWVLVKSLQRLFHKSGSSMTAHICSRCTRRFSTPTEMEAHRLEGKCQVWQQPVDLPQRGSTAAVATFSDWSKMLVVPFCAYYV